MSMYFHVVNVSRTWATLLTSAPNEGALGNRGMASSTLVSSLRAVEVDLEGRGVSLYLCESSVDLAFSPRLIGTTGRSGDVEQCPEVSGVRPRYRGSDCIAYADAATAPRLDEESKGRLRARGVQ